MSVSRTRFVSSRKVFVTCSFVCTIVIVALIDAVNGLDTSKQRAHVQHRELLPQEDVARILRYKNNEVPTTVLREHAKAVGEAVGNSLLLEVSRREAQKLEDDKVRQSNGFLSMLKSRLLKGSNEEESRSLDRAQAGLVECNYMESSAKSNKQLCCRVWGSWRCFPSTIIIGAQKSGTTALFAHLLHHKNVSLPRDKELHFFDYAPNWNRGLLSYLRRFEEYPKEINLKNFISLEASPSYMATQNTCKRIRAVLPSARLIILLRDPAQRAWSEFNMSRRLRAGEEAMRHLVEKHATEFRGCAEDAFSSQAPRNATSFVRYTFRRYTHNKLVDCVPLELGGLEVFRRAAWKLVKHMEESSEWRDCWKKLGRMKLSSWLKQWKECSPPAPLGARDWTRNFVEQTAEDATAEFLEKIAKEQSRILSCKRKLNFLSCNDNDRPSDLSRDYLWRGLYKKQISECLRWFPREQLLILHGEDLREKPQETMNQVIEFLSLPPHDYSFVKDEDVMRTFDEVYPHFAEVTGWDTSMGSLKLSASDGKALRKFYTPHNEELFALLGQRFELWMEPREY